MYKYPATEIYPYTHPLHELRSGMACAGEYKRVQVLLLRSLDLNPDEKCYIDFFFGYYQNGNYKEALRYAQK